MGNPERRWARQPRAALSLSMLFLAAPALAMDIFPDGLMPAPAGLSAASLFLAHAERDSMYAQGTRSPLRAALDSDQVTFKLVHFIEAGGHPVQLIVLLPYGQQRASADTAALGKASGLGDLGLGVMWWAASDPATGNHWALSANLFLPSGQYDHSHPLNMGEHRTRLTVLGGGNVRLASTLQAVFAADVSAYGDNDQFGSAGVRMAQAHSYQVQSFLRYQMWPHIETVAGLSRVWGGAREVAGVAREDALATNKFLLGANGLLMPKTYLSVLYSRDMAVRQGFREAKRLTLRLSRSF